MRIKCSAVLFDLDGTLIDSIAEIRRAWQAFAGKHGLDAAGFAATEMPTPHVLVTANDVTKGKPDAEGYLLCARGLGAEPSRCVVVEDAVAGLVAAESGGMIPVAVATNHRPAELFPSRVVTREPAGIHLVGVKDVGRSLPELELEIEPV